MLPAFKMFMGGPIGTGNQWFSWIQDDVVAMMARPSWMPVPGFVLETMLGEGATVVLHGQQVLPKGLLDRGFSFQYAELPAALRACV
jgi:uncharacterized protein